MEHPPECHILPPGPGDALALAEVHVRAWRETYAGLLPALLLDRMSVPLHARRWRAILTSERPKETVLCVEGPKGILGYCAADTQGGSALVSTLYLVREAQGQGLGRALLSTQARLQASRGARALRLWMLEGNHRARGFYERLGGLAGERRALRGWGQGQHEIAFDWPNIGSLIGPVTSSRP